MIISNSEPTLTGLRAALQGLLTAAELESIAGTREPLRSYQREAVITFGALDDDDLLRFLRLLRAGAESKN